MNIYLAAKKSRHDELLHRREELLLRHHSVRSGCLDAAYSVANLSGREVVALQRVAASAISVAVEKCDLFVVFTAVANIPAGTEEWRPFPRSRLGYFISSFGRVRNAVGTLVRGKSRRGYIYVLPNGKHGGYVAVHQAVMLAFCGGCPRGREIDHVDGAKTNNWLGNLEYVTHLENIRRGEVRGTRRCAGVANGRAKLTDDDAYAIREFSAAGVSRAELSRRFAVSETAVRNIVKGRAWCPNFSGDMWVEFGMALYLSKPIWVVGSPSERCCFAPTVRRFQHWRDCLPLLQGGTK